MKKNIRKRFVSVFMIVVLMTSMCTHLTGCGAKETTTTDTQVEFEKDADTIYLTKGEWIRELAILAGLTESTTTQPYFTDIKASDELFPYVQAAGDWKLFEESGGDFNPDADVTREFAIATAVIASDILEEAGYVTEDEIKKHKKKSHLQGMVTFVNSE